MRQFHSSLLAILLLGIVTSCADTPIPTNRYEEHAREFIKEFGQPAEGHDFSMAKTAGLQIHTSKEVHVTVTGMYEGDEYLFADVTLPQGTTPVPCTVPAVMDKLLVNVGENTYTADRDGVFDLDNPPASRTITADENSGALSFSNDDGDRPILVWRFSQGISSRFTEDPEISNYYTGTTTGNVTLLYGESGFARDADGVDAVYDIFPIYWDSKWVGTKDFQTALHQTEKIANTYTIIENPEKNKPFPDLGFTKTLKIATGNNTPTDEEKANDEELSKLLEDILGDPTKVYTEPDHLGVTFDDGTFTQCYNSTRTDYMHLNDGDFIVVSKGHRVKIKGGATKLGVAIDIRYNRKDDGSYTLSSSQPWFNYLNWGGNKYFATYIHTLPDTYTSTNRSNCSSGNVINIYDPDTKTVKTFNGSSMYMIEFVQAPDGANIKRASNPGYCNRRLVKYLLVPVNESGKFVFPEVFKSIKNFEWTIAAEDLGGTFDWDFNDAVFSFTDIVTNLRTINTTRSATGADGSLFNKTLLYGPDDAATVRAITVKPRAAGGTLPIYIAYTGQPFKPDYTKMIKQKGPDAKGQPEKKSVWYADGNNALLQYISDNAPAETDTYILGTELHHWLGGESTDKIINVGEKRSSSIDSDALAVEFWIPTNFDHNQFYSNFKNLLTGHIGTTEANANGTLMGFTVIVDKEGKINVPDDNQYMKLSSVDISGAYEISAPKYDGVSVAPQLILVEGGDWRWPRELQNIGLAYSGFQNWVKSGTTQGTSAWHKTYDKQYVTGLQND